MTHALGVLANLRTRYNAECERAGEVVEDIVIHERQLAGSTGVLLVQWEVERG